VINRSSKLVSYIIDVCTIMGISKLQGADDVSCCHRLGTRLRFASSATPTWHVSSSLSLSRLSHFWAGARTSLNFAAIYIDFSPSGFRYPVRLRLRTTIFYILHLALLISHPLSNKACDKMVSTSNPREEGHAYEFLILKDASLLG
jgi:hypothetical protein